MNKTMNNAPVIDMEIPSNEGVFAALAGSSAKVLGLGVESATGKDGVTTGHIITIMAQRSNGRTKITALQDVIEGIPSVYSRAWNKYTRIFKTRNDALRAVATASKDFNLPVLRNESEEISHLPTDEKKETTEKKGKKTIADIINARIKGDKNALDNFLDAIGAVDCIDDYFSTVVGLMKTVNKAHNSGVLISVIDGIVDNAEKAINDAIKTATETAKKAKEEKATEEKAVKNNNDRNATLKKVA